jgi:transposase
MMKAYSQDLRERILKTVDEGKTQAQTASLMKVSEATVKRYVRQRREKGHVQRKPIPGRPPKKRAPLESWLQAQLERVPDATFQEQCDLWEAEKGEKVSIMTMSRAIERLEWTRKKKSSGRMSERRKNAAHGKNKQKSLIPNK